MALADPTRRHILEALRGKTLSVTDLAKTQLVSRPAVSQHLRVLEAARLVSAEARGSHRLYSIRRDGLDALGRYLESFRSDVLTAYSDDISKRNNPN
jgi:DNA-binding transcriptional ArsR family regulator